MAESFVGLVDATNESNRLAISANGAIAITTATGGGVVTVTPQAAVNLYSEVSTSRTTSGNTANQTWVSGVSTVFIGVNVTAFTGGTSPTLVVSLQQQDTNGVFQTVANSSTITTTGAVNFSVGAGMTNAAMIPAGGTYRFAWTVTGAPATLSFQIGMSGR
jgi:hypothetical protein